jgi:hypothetical protein
MTCGIYVIEGANLAATRDGRGTRSDVILGGSDSFDRRWLMPCGWTSSPTCRLILTINNKNIYRQYHWIQLGQSEGQVHVHYVPRCEA